MSWQQITVLAASAAVAAAGGIFYRRAKRKPPVAGGSPESDAAARKKQKRNKLLALIAGIAGSWVFTVTLLNVIFGHRESKPFGFEINVPRVDLFGFSISQTVIVSWIIMAVLIILALLVRIFCVRKFSDSPKGLQNVLETIVEWLCKYTDNNVSGMKMSMSFGAYLFTLVLFMVGCAVAELFGVRAPTSDLTLTFALALITFVLLNYYGIKKKGIGGRLKSLGTPYMFIMPIRMLCDVAIPVSLACRLFGNMLGGMIVIDLLYYALGSAAVGIPSVIGLYFNVFHPLIQAFIFVTLTLSYINEATE